GPGPRGLQFGEAAGQNLTDTSEAIDDFQRAERTAISIKSTTTARDPVAFVQAVGNWTAELEDWDYPVKVTYRTGRQEWVDPRIDVSARGLLVGVDVEDVRSWGGNAR